MRVCVRENMHTCVLILLLVYMPAGGANWLYRLAHSCLRARAESMPGGLEASTHVLEVGEDPRTGDRSSQPRGSGSRSGRMLRRLDAVQA